MKRIATLVLTMSLLYVTLQSRNGMNSVPEMPSEAAFDENFYSEVPVSEKPAAMGASDPTWSPDGKEVGFSLFWEPLENVGGMW